VNPEETIPVVITYGSGQETHLQVYRAIMEPAGVPAAEPVTVMLVLPKLVAGDLVTIGLYDGGHIGPADPPDTPNTPTTPISPFVPYAGAAVLKVAEDGTVLFRFRAGRTLGLYRALITIGPAQYLLQFYAVRPRPAVGSSPLPSPHPIVTPQPPPIG
jgi:hypothetical protein